MVLQKQHDLGYRDKKLLRDRLMAAISILSIQGSLGDHTSRTAELAVNRIEKSTLR